MVTKFLLSISLLLVPLLLGYSGRKAGYLKEQWARKAILFSTVAFGPCLSLLVFWVIEIPAEAILLPVTGFIVSSLALLSAFFSSVVHKHGRKQRGAYLVSASTSNIGYTLGGFICYLLMEEQGYALSVIYTLYLVFFRYGVCYPMARYYGGGKGQSPLRSLLKMTTDIRSAPLLGLVAGILLNVSGLRRPEFLSTVLGVLIVLAAFISVGSIGLTIHPHRAKQFLAEYFSISLIKFALSPLAALAMGGLVFGFTGVPLRVTFILSLMPASVMSTVISSLFRLDQDIANSLFLVNTLSFFLILPVMFVIVGHLP